MLHPRLIPCLLVRNKGLVKTVKFKDSKYVGDPINAVKIFNEKEVDELIVLDIDASVENREPDFKMIENLANECRMPFCYGGGIKTVEQASKILSLGVEKIALSSAAIRGPEIISEISTLTGSQSVVIVLDIKKKMFGGYDVCINNGQTKTKVNLIEFIREAQALGAGEFVINSIDNDGMMKGYDFALIDKIKAEVGIPITILGGASSLENIEEAISRYGVIGCSAGSLFVFKGKYRAVLINYPNSDVKEALISASNLFKAV